MKYFFENDLFSDRQYVFIRNRSAVLQLLKVTNEWSRLLDEGKQIYFIYTDFEKAFDKVPLWRLLGKLVSYCVNDLIINWIEAFLCGRSQCDMITASHQIGAVIIAVLL